jgi:RNAse (barnase) inhibitor barstar
MTEVVTALLSKIARTETPFINLDSELSAKSVVKRLESEGFFATLVDRAPIFNKDTLLHALYQSCLFPAYFGFNWDALEDCLNDFSWLIAEGYVLVFQDFMVLKERSPEVAETFETIVSDVFKTRKEIERKPLIVLMLNSERD